MFCFRCDLVPYSFFPSYLMQGPPGKRNSLFYHHTRWLLRLLHHILFLLFLSLPLHPFQPSIRFASSLFLDRFPLSLPLRQLLRRPFQPFHPANQMEPKPFPSQIPRTLLPNPHRPSSLRLLCFFYRSIDEQQSSALRTAWHRKNLLDRLDREAVRHALYLFFSLSSRRRDRQRSGNASIERIRRAACSTRVVSSVCRYGAVDSGARSFDDVDGTQPIETNRFVADGRGVSLGTRSNSGGGEGARGDNNRRDDR